MKVSDIMLDLATGDASQYDAYIQESVGQVRVSSAYYNAGVAIASATDSEREQFVQEAADAGLPSDQEGAMELVYEAVERELVGTCRHLYMESAKFLEVFKKGTSPLGAVNALAKKCGVEESINGSKEYATKLANAVVSKGISLKDGKFVKASSAKKAIKALIQSAVQIACAFGIECDELRNDESVKAVAPGLSTSKCNGDCSLAYMADAIKSASKHLDGVELTESDYTKSISKGDLASLILCSFAAAKSMAFINDKLKKDGKAAEKRAKKAVDDCNKKSIDGAAADLNEKDSSGTPSIVKTNKDLGNLNKSVIKAINDSIYSLVNAKNS